jgi:hypothetical protein
MSEKIEIQIGGKPYAFEPDEPRTIRGVLVRLSRSMGGSARCVIEGHGVYILNYDETFQTSFDEALRQFHKSARRQLSSERESPDRIRRQIARLQRDLEKAPGSLARQEARTAKALRFGSKR